MLLNVTVFMWFGAVCPWSSFAHNDVIPIYRLIPLGMLVLLLRRLPMILLFHKQIHQVEEIKHALFMGWFGPIGVSAIFYLYISREYLRQIVYLDEEREDAHHLSEVLNVVVWFLVICSVICHGLSVPLGKLGFWLPRTISTAISSERPSREPSTSRARGSSPTLGPRTNSQETRSAYGWIANTFSGGALKRKMRHEDHAAHDGNDIDLHGQVSHPDISRPSNLRVLGGRIVGDGATQQSLNDAPADSSSEQLKAGNASDAPQQSDTVTPVDGPWQRKIRFPDEPSHG